MCMYVQIDLCVCARAHTRLCNCLCATATSQFWNSFYGFISLPVWVLAYLLQHFQSLNLCLCIGRLSLVRIAE